MIESIKPNESLLFILKMIADASMGKFADRLGTQLADNLLDAGFEKAAIEAVSKRRSFDPADFR